MLLQPPASAERFDLITHLQTERAPSKFAPGAFALHFILDCPNCRHRFPEPPMCAPIACECGLTLQLEGVSLFVWRDEVKLQAAE